VPQDASGNYDITVDLHYPHDPESICLSRTFTLEVIPVSLPEQTLRHTEWFHCDCLSVWYKTPVFSEEHWHLMEAYMANAVRYGINMIFTPIFTPPLDTQIGGERPTVQLVDVFLKNGAYSFGFSRLKRYLDMARRIGFQYFEMSHLFSQWGAAFAPKIVAEENGEVRRIFGFDTDAHSEEYVSFLNTFLPELIGFLRQEGILDDCYFHISDEPSENNMESFRQSVESVRDALNGCRVMDALSHYSFYEQGLVGIPVPTVDAAEDFLDKGIPELWVYYCCGQVNQVSNRFFAMPSSRCRILGWQLFKYNIQGFLQWGFNFWFSQYSRFPINPFFTTDAGNAFPSGDAFMVYPGDNGPIPSIHQLVFHESLQDLRALQLLAQYMTHEEIAAWLDSECAEPMTFTTYPRGAEFLLTLREKLNRKIAGLVDSDGWRFAPLH